ncbi:leucine-rich repeat domain-containing protein, partial [Clostridium perfringens]|uniref:leucine-rich repeat domain-containing protein n=1 Tax=Clostridium perfringens TaxID=1502 RepID=UPI002247F87E
NNQLTNVEIPNGVTSIGDNAFFNNQLTSVKLPDSITSLNGFTNNQLTSVEIPNGVISIGDNAFNTNKLTSIQIPNSVTYIGNYAFALNKLKNLKIGSSVKEIGNGSFENNQLTSVTLPNSVEEIGYSTFRTNQLSNLILPNSVNRVGSHIIDDNKIKNIYYENINGKYIVDLKKVNPNIKTNNVKNIKINSISSITNGNYDSNTGIIMLDKKPISGTKITYTYDVSNKNCLSPYSTITLLLENELVNSESELKDKAISNVSYYDLDDIILEGNIESDKTFDKNIKKSILVKSKDGQVKLEKNVENTDKYGNGYSGFKAILSKDDFDKIGNLIDGTIEIKIEYNGEVITLPYNINPANKNSRMSTGYFDWESTHYKIENFPSIELGKNTVSIKVDSNNRVLLNNKVNDYGINLLAYYLNNDRYVFDLGIECGNFDISTEEHKNIFEVKDSNGNV